MKKKISSQRPSTKPSQGYANAGINLSGLLPKGERIAPLRTIAAIDTYVEMQKLARQSGYLLAIPSRRTPLRRLVEGIYDQEMIQVSADPTSPKPSIEPGLASRLIEASNAIYKATLRDANNWIHIPEGTARAAGLIPPKKTPLQRLVEGVFDDDEA